MTPPTASLRSRPAASGRVRGDGKRRREEDQRLQRRQRHGDRNARAELAERYLPLARNLALRYRNSREPLEDLVQVAALGLVKAVERWDPERGTAFSTFAVPTILGELRRYFRDHTWAVKPPRGTQELALLLPQARDRLWHELGRPPTVAEIAALLGRSDEDVLDAVQATAAQHGQSLDMPITDRDDDSATFLDRLGDTEPGYAHAEDGLVVDDLTRILDPRAREVLRLRFRDELLQSEIGRRVGCSQMHVSRIIRDSLDKLQRYAERRPLPYR